MAVIGLKYPVYSLLTETDTTATYASGKVIAKAMKANLSVETSNEKLYADDGIAENIKEFKEGKLELGIDNLEDTIAEALLGHTLEDTTIEGETGAKMLVSKDTDEGGYVGIGFYGRKIVSGVKSFRAIWLTKVKFSEPSEELETKGETVSFKTPALEGTIMKDVTGTWKKEVTVSTESAAKTWLNTMAAIV